MIANSPNQSHNKHLQGLPDTPKTATTLLSDKDRQAAQETAKAADERPIPAVSDLAATSGTPPSFDGFEHGWILVTLCQGNLQKLYESDDLLGVFIYVSALHNTFKERAPALYEQSVQLRLAEWYTVHQENVWVNGEIIWRGRTIPRTNVVPVPARRGDYLDLDGDRVFAEPYYYSPPSTASETERNRTR